MAKIIRITPTSRTSQISSPLRNTRSTVTNPFKYSNFEGNTLQFADVFEGFEPKTTNKMKLIASSVAGTMHKMRTGTVESIINFAKKVKANMTCAWEYAKNTNVSDLAAVKKFNDIMNTQIEIPGIKTLEKSMDTIKTRISTKIGVWNENLIDYGKDINTKWQAIIAKIQPKKLTSDVPVSELERLWKEELALAKVEGVA